MGSHNRHAVVKKKQANKHVRITTENRKGLSLLFISSRYYISHYLANAVDTVFKRYLSLPNDN